MKKIFASLILVFSFIFISPIALASKKCKETEETDINIVLAHGIFGFDKIGSVDYFNGIKQYLEEKHNAKVLVTAVSRTGGIKERGNQLKQQIINAINKPNAPSCFNSKAPTHIVAHSMGGLDSRYILSPGNSQNIGHLITSLTTIGTPHKGSPLADLFFAGFNPIVDFSKLWFNVDGIMRSLSKSGIKKDGIHDLTTAEMRKFNLEYKDNPNISYFWITGIGRNSFRKTSYSLLPTHAYIEYVTKEYNDGAVALSSARYGEAIGKLWYADHFDQVGHDFDNLPHGMPKKFNYFAKYDEIIEKIRVIQSK
jgi:triacylglycerol lipase